ncbi:hypothetical protein PM082_004843 [Marasmius tenuissimus]|nr:hypothetical protein PM082_004843 [Marasmius tenuissimus]
MFPTENPEKSNDGPARDDFGPTLLSKAPFLLVPPLLVIHPVLQYSPRESLGLTYSLPSGGNAAVTVEHQIVPIWSYKFQIERSMPKTVNGLRMMKLEENNAISTTTVAPSRHIIIWHRKQPFALTRPLLHASTIRIDDGDIDDPSTGKEIHVPISDVLPVGRSFPTISLSAAGTSAELSIDRLRQDYVMHARPSLGFVAPGSLDERRSPSFCYLNILLISLGVLVYSSETRISGLARRRSSWFLPTPLSTLVNQTPSRRCLQPSGPRATMATSSSPRDNPILARAVTV